MATVNARNLHAAGRRADVYGMYAADKSSDPWNRTGSTALQPVRMRQPQQSARQSRIDAAIRSIVDAIEGNDMTRKIDVGGNQGRGNPPAGRPSQFMAHLDYTEPETAELKLAPPSHAERALIRVAFVLSALAMVALVVSCLDGVAL